MAEQSDAMQQSLDNLQTELHQLPARVGHARAEMVQALNWSQHLLTVVQQELRTLPVAEEAGQRERAALAQSITELQEAIARQAADGQRFEAQLQRLIAELARHFGLGEAR
jgi:chromosome segregation ATPase